MALGNLQKRKSVFSASSKGRPAVSKRGKCNLLVKKGKSAATDSKKRQQKAGLVSGSKRKVVSWPLEGRVCSMFTKLIESGTVADHEAVFYMRKRDQSVMKEGKVTRDGVLCCCCSRIFGLSKFEAHAGSALHRPSANMFLRDGRSIMDCLHSADSTGQSGNATGTGKRVSSKGKSQLDDGNDNICQICGDGGQLMLCDSCPSAFHYGCLHLDAVPDGDWHCSRCRCGSCGLGKGRETGESGSSMICCMQCQVPYHQSCLSKCRSRFEGTWFCTKRCQSVFEKLRKLVGSIFAIDKDLSWMLLRSSGEESIALETATSQDRLCEALKILQQCFDPIIDQESGVNVLSQLVYSRKSSVRRLDCSGFYIMLLMKGEQLVSVATVRTHGKALAEVPFIATECDFRQQGMCRALMQALELMLRGVGVYKLVIPSINEVVETWTSSFGFKAMSLQDRKQFAGTIFFSFPGTILLSKSLIGPMTRSRSEPVLEMAEVHGRSVIQVKEQMLAANKSSLSRSRAISCH
ncbi:hypothetical protein GOP47_0010811 [Adiantum capillus-veneris]|uniref:Uncharacterized protein n=1 Tax=Adiantum capillus-veneris TaxID=13818 RepID=A0A9D4UV91_ADICA|nr:hypothetical protein GOP47_0010811 [Adiantum capillus-veneris]